MNTTDGLKAEAGVVMVPDLCPVVRLPRLKDQGAALEVVGHYPYGSSIWKCEACGDWHAWAGGTHRSYKAPAWVLRLVKRARDKIVKK